MHYFDSLSARPPRPTALQRYQEACQNSWAHPASVHQPAQQLLRELRQAYHTLASFCGATSQDTLLFCGSIEEAVAQMIQGVWADQARLSGRSHFLTSALDEAAIILNLEKLSAFGASHDLVGATSSGQIDLEALKKAIHPRTQMVCLSWANSLTGVIQPIEQIAALCRERGVLLGLDASALSGLYPMQQLPADFICFSGTSVGGLHGSAALWLREGQRLAPLLPCGHDWMHSTAAHPAALLALAEAARETAARRDRDLWHLAHLKSYFESQLKARCAPVTILFESSERLVHVTSVAFPGVHAELLAWHLNRKQLYVPFGGGMRQQIHYLLKACHVSPQLHHSALSFALTPEMTQEGLDAAITLLADTLQQLRRLHHFAVEPL